MIEGRAPAWLALFAPIPADARPLRKPVAPAGSALADPGSPIAGWESMILDLSAPPFGTRLVMVALDETGTPLSASDHVMTRDAAGAPAAPVHVTQVSVGGRIES